MCTRTNAKNITTYNIQNCVAEAAYEKNTVSVAPVSHQSVSQHNTTLGKLQA